MNKILIVTTIKEDDMAKRLSFAEFRDGIEKHLIPLDLLGDYVEFDPDSPVPRLIFRSDALFDNPPEDYDVDSAIYQLLQELEEECDTHFRHRLS